MAAISKLGVSTANHTPVADSPSDTRSVKGGLMDSARTSISTNEDAQQDETQQPSPAALFSGFPVGFDALWDSMLAPAGDGACSGRSAE